MRMLAARGSMKRALTRVFFRAAQLTDFSSFAFPQISVATPAEMFAISPQDIVTKVRARSHMRSYTGVT
jgi:hypothetical protein